MSSFRFALILRPIFDTIEARLSEVDPRATVLAILDDITINVGTRWAQWAFQVVMEEL